MKLIIILALLFSSPVWGRTMLEDQPRSEQCKYKASLTSFVVYAYQQAGKNNAPMPSISVNFLPDASEAERALVQGYKDNAIELALTSKLSPQKAGESTFVQCMRAMDVNFLRVGSVRPPVIKDLHFYKMEWCYTIGIDAQEIIAHLEKHGIEAFTKLHHLVQATKYFSPNKKKAVHALLESARAAMKNETPPGEWFTDVTRSCME